MMTNVDQMMALLGKLSGKTLEDLRAEALVEVSGIKFDAIRAENGPRFLVVMCVTKGADIQQLSAGLALDRFPPIRQDWSSIVLSDLVTMAIQGLRSGQSSGFIAVPRISQAGKRDALVLICAGPDSIAKLESVFKMPQ